LQRHSGGKADGFVLGLGFNGKTLFSSYLGGAAADSATDAALNGTSSLVVVGATDSKDFPVKGRPFQGHLKGKEDAFVTKVALR
ncbi:MAG: hypothetical protein M3290_04485, partial [Actinomycetota bacterium]|nr:hypothetical protein [Actinomycetota bacterium]